MNQESRTHKALRNSTYKLFGYIFPIVFSIAITPIIVNKLGVVDYGFMVFVNSMLAILTLLDMGVGNATLKHITEYHSKNDQENLKKTLSTSNSIFLTIGVTGALLVAIATAIIWVFFHSRVGDNPEFLIIAGLAAINFLISSSNNTYTIIPSSLQRFDISTILSSLNLTITSIGTLIAVLIFPNITSIFAAQLFVSIVFFFIWRINSLKLLPQAKYSLGIDKYEMKRSVSFGAYASINELAKTALFSLDRLLIPVYLGAAHLTYYTIPGNLTSRITGVSDNISGIIFPLSAHLNATGDIEALKKTYIRSVRLLLLVATSITFAIALNGEKILKYWINAEVAQNGALVIIILSFTNLMLALFSPISSFFMAMNKWKFYTKISISMALINVVTLLILLPKYGINGAAWAYLISTLPIAYAIFVMEKKYLDIHGFVKKWSKQIAQHIAAGIVFALFNAFIINPFITNLWTLIILGPASVVVYILIYSLLGFTPKEDRDDIYQYLKNAFRKRI